MKRRLTNFLITSISIVLVIFGYLIYTEKVETNYANEEVFNLEDIPEYSGEPYVVINNNIPFFEEVSSEYYFEPSELDILGRCGEAKALVGINTLADEERGSISDIKPSGWHIVRYDDLIGSETEPGYLYNRCHLIMFALTGNQSNVKENLITGTRYLNVIGMLPFEMSIVDYIEETGNNVEYHVTPIFEGIELVPRGVLMEARSEEGFMFNIFCYNVQPGVKINYLTGSSYRE